MRKIWSRSPLSYVDRIRIPLFIAQGANDPRVKQAESEQIVAALTAKGIPHEYMLFPDEGHGFAKPENRLKFYPEVKEAVVFGHGRDYATAFAAGVLARLGGAGTKRPAQITSSRSSRRV